MMWTRNFFARQPGMIWLLAALFLLVWHGWYLASEAQGQKPIATVKVGVVPTLAEAATFIAEEKGYFQERGLKVELVNFPSAAQAMAPLGTGEIQVAGGAVGVGLFNAAARGWSLRIVENRASFAVPGYSGDYFMVRPDLKDAIKTPKDLKGRKVAVNAPGSGLLYPLGKALEGAGLTMKDIDLVYIPFPQMGIAFKNKAIEVALQVEPFVALLEEQGLAAKWLDCAEVAKGMQIGVLMYNIDWAKSNPQAAKEYMVAFLKGARDYYQAMRGGKNRAEIIELLAQRTAVKDRALYNKMDWMFHDPNGLILKEDLEAQQEWYMRQGLLKQKVAMDNLVDESFLRYALQQLGPYPCDICPRKP